MKLPHTNTAANKPWTETNFAEAWRRVPVLAEAVSKGRTTLQGIMRMCVKTTIEIPANVAAVEPAVQKIPLKGKPLPVVLLKNIVTAKGFSMNLLWAQYVI